MANYRLTRADFLQVIDGYSSQMSLDKREVTAICTLWSDFETLAFYLDHCGIEYTARVIPSREGNSTYTFKFILPSFKHCEKYGIDRKF